MCAWAGARAGRVGCPMGSCNQAVLFASPQANLLPQRPRRRAAGSLAQSSPRSRKHLRGAAGAVVGQGCLSSSTGAGAAAEGAEGGMGLPSAPEAGTAEAQLPQGPAWS